MGDVDIKKVKSIDPVSIRELSNVTHIEPLRIGQIAPAAVHIKELNHIDPISVDSLRIDQIRNLDPVRVERFDVTSLPTVNLSLSRFPAMEVNLRRIPPLTVGLQQDLRLPSHYTIHARFLGIEVMRLHVHGLTTLSPQDRVCREQIQTHERSCPEVVAVGNPAIPVRREERAVMVHRSGGYRCRPQPVPQPLRETRPDRAPRSHRGVSTGPPPLRFSLGGASPAEAPSGAGGGR
jgi:hypothetical protein